MGQHNINLTFITGNQNKADYLARLLGFSLRHQKVELEEIQSTSSEVIVEQKVRQAYQIINRPVLVEDAALGFAALSGLLGPFIKFFVEQPDGLEKLCRMLDGFTDRSAVGGTTYGYYDGAQLKLFRAELKGTISAQPRGQGGYGWDAIFCPDGYHGQTRAELSAADDAKTYELMRPFGELREFLTARANGL